MLIKQKPNYVTKPKSVKLFLTGAIVAIGLSSNAFANDLTKTERVDVTINAADLKSEDGVAKVYGDLARAAKSACEPGSSFSYSKSTIEACEADLMDQFITSLDHADITKLHTVKVG